VGDELTDFLLRKEPLSTVIRRENIGYLITMNSFNYRSIYDDTELETIYTFDQSAEVGDMIEIAIGRSRRILLLRRIIHMIR